MFSYLSLKKVFSKYINIIFALFISAICYNLFVYPTKMVYGGAGGIATIVSTCFNIPPSKFILFFSIIVLFISLFMLGIKKTSGSILATFVYPLFVELTSGLNSILNFEQIDLLLVALFIGVLSGITSGMIYKAGFSSGGVSLINQILSEKMRISISKCSFFSNFIIVLAGGIFYGFEMVLYAIIILFVNSIVINKVMLGISNNKNFYIFTSKCEEVKNYLLNEMKNDITEFKVISGYSNNTKDVIMTIVSTNCYYDLSNFIKSIDSDAFFVVTDIYEVAQRNKKNR